MNNRYIVVVEYLSNSTLIPAKVLELLSSIGHSLQLTEHSFIIVTDQTSVFIRDAIKNSPYDVEGVFVIACDVPAAWRKSLSDNDDIKAILHE